MMLQDRFFDRPACEVAIELLGKVIRHKYKGHWLAAQIIETESYYLHDRASHASLGFSEKKRALFMPAGTIYMYYARGMDSFNISTQGEGNAVLVKSAVYFEDEHTSGDAFKLMQALNPLPSSKARPSHRLCSGQALLCRSLGLKVTDWDRKTFNHHLYIDDTGYRPASIIQTTRLGIPAGRDEDLLQRYIDEAGLSACTKKPTRHSVVKRIKPRSSN